MLPVMVKKTFFTKLHCIICVDMPSNKDLHLCDHEEVFLALVKTCKTEQDRHRHQKYSNLGGVEFIDLATIRQTVGCVYDRGAWYSVGYLRYKSLQYLL